MSEAWEEIEPGRKHRRHDGWLVVVSVDGGIHVITPHKSDAVGEDGRKRTFDSVSAAMDFVDQHHPS